MAVRNDNNAPASDNEAPALTEQEKRDAHYAEGHVTAKHEELGGQYDAKAKKEDNDA